MRLIRGLSGKNFFSYFIITSIYQSTIFLTFYYCCCYSAHEKAIHFPQRKYAVKA